MDLFQNLVFTGLHGKHHSNATLTQGKHSSSVTLKRSQLWNPSSLTTLQSNFRNECNPHLCCISCTWWCCPNQHDEVFWPPSVCQEAQVSALHPTPTRRSKTGHRMEQRAHTSQIQFEPVHTALRTSPASLPSWQKIIDFNLWPPNHERTCEGERFADEGDIKETKPG